MTQKEILFNVKVDTGNSAKDIKGVADSTKSLDKQLEELNKEVNSGNLGVRELSKKLQEYESIALKAGKSSPIGRRAIRDAANLKDNIDDLRGQISGLSDDGAKLNSALTLSTGVLGGYQGFLGVTTLLGKENEQLLEVLTKMQAVQSITNSLSAVRNALDKTQVAQYKALIQGTGLYTMAQTGLTTAIGTTTGAAKALRIALIATGIGAIVVAVGLLIANFEKLSEWVMNGVRAFDNIGTKVKVVLSIIFPFIGVIWGIIEGLKALGVIESKSAREKKKAEEIKRAELKKTRDEERKVYKQRKNFHMQERRMSREKIKALEFEVRKRKALGKETIAMEREVIQERIKDLKTELKLNKLRIEEARKQQEYSKQQSKINTQQFAEARKQLSTQRASHLLDKFKIHNSIKNLEEDLTILELEQLKKRQDNAKEYAEKRKALAQELADFLKGLEKERYELENDEFNIRKKEIEEEEQQRLEFLQQKREEGLMTEREYLQQVEEVRQLAFKKYMEIEEEQNELKREQEEQERQEELDRLEEFYEKQQELKDKFYEEEKKKDDLRRQNKEMIDNMIIESSQKSFQILNDLAEAFSNDSEQSQRRMFNMQKAASIGQASVDTFQAAQAAYTNVLSAPSSKLMPDGGVTLASISAGVAVAAGLANIAKIKSQKFGGSGASGGAGGGASTPRVSPMSSAIQDSARSIEMFGQANTGSEVFAQSGIDDTVNVTVKAEVVESEMTQTQNDVATIENRAELG